METENLRRIKHDWENFQTAVVRIVLVTADKKLLFLQRPMDAKQAPGKWSMIGGKIEQQFSKTEMSDSQREHHRLAAVRELTEETNLNESDVKAIYSLAVYSNDADRNNAKRVHTAIVAVQVKKGSDQIALIRDVGTVKPDVHLTAFSFDHLPANSEDWAFGYLSLLKRLFPQLKQEIPPDTTFPLERHFDVPISHATAMLGL